ncbi:Hypothetical protein D9617_89g071740 [Elsinoe fawcettii]|nr:Hypothetical protein D9617_89g071740 [Elsinoe fawcettii]
MPAIFPRVSGSESDASGSDDGYSPTDPSDNDNGGQNAPIPTGHSLFQQRLFVEDVMNFQRWVRKKFDTTDQVLAGIKKTTDFNAVLIQNNDARNQNGRATWITDRLIPLVYLKEEEEGKISIARITVDNFNWNVASLWELLQFLHQLATMNEEGRKNKSKDPIYMTVLELCGALEIGSWEHWYIYAKVDDRKNITTSANRVEPYKDLAEAVLYHPDIAAERLAAAIGVDLSSLRESLQAQPTLPKRKNTSEQVDQHSTKRRRTLGTAPYSALKAGTAGRDLRDKTAEEPSDHMLKPHQRSQSPAVKLPIDVLLGRAPIIEESVVSDKPESDQMEYIVRPRSAPEDSSDDESVHREQTRTTRRVLPRRSSPSATTKSTSRRFSVESFNPSVDVGPFDRESTKRDTHK